MENSATHYVIKSNKNRYIKVDMENEFAEIVECFGHASFVYFEEALKILSHVSNNFASANDKWFIVEVEIKERPRNQETRPCVVCGYSTDRSALEVCYVCGKKAHRLCMADDFFLKEFDTWIKCCRKCEEKRNEIMNKDENET